MNTRLLFNSGMFNELYRRGFHVSKSEYHSDGEACFGGWWFIVQADLPGIGQISNYYKFKDWELFDCQKVEKADEWDGHTPQDVIVRIREFLTKKEGD